MRLDKFLSDMGIGTRSELKKTIKSGAVKVDGTVVRNPSFSVSPSSQVTIGGVPVVYEEFVYYMLNKPAGIISASEDSREETVVDLIAEPRRKDIFPVGRLDRDTEGLLLITNDGDLAHRLLSPRHHVDKLYTAVVAGKITEREVESFANGLILPDGLECLPATLEILSYDENADTTAVNVTIQEGKFHQIKRMFEAVGSRVLYLKRQSMGTLELGSALAPGEYRRLTDEELSGLKSLTNS